LQHLPGRYDGIRDLSNQGGQENLSGGIIKSILVNLPSLPEQTKIATFVTTVDEKLNALKQKNPF
jgi:type I restriction enzyme S subunit